MNNNTKIQYEQERQGGFACPICSKNIPVSITDIAYGKGIVCPNCGLCLSIDTTASKDAIRLTKRLTETRGRQGIH